MFCSLRENQPGKTTQQILLEFYNEIEELALGILLKQMFAYQVKEFLKAAKRHGYKTIEKLLENVDVVLILFFEKEWHEHNVEEVIKEDFPEKRYRIAA